MRALVLGGAGGMGQGVARDLVKQQQVTDVVLADLYPDPERLAPKLRDSEKGQKRGSSIPGKPLCRTKTFCQIPGFIFRRGR